MYKQKEGCLLLLVFRILRPSREGARVSLPPTEGGATFFLRGVGGAGPQAYRMWGLSSWTWDQTWATAVTPNGQTPENSLGTTRKGLTFHFKQR